MKKTCLFLASTLFFIHYSFAQWSSIGPNGGAVTSFVSDGTHLFAGASGGVFMSTNNGATWTSSSNGLTAIAHIQCLAINGSTLLAGADGGIFSSTDNGSTWTLFGLEDTAVSCIKMIGSDIFVGTNYQGIHVYSGSSWSIKNNGLTDLHVKDIVFDADANKIYTATSGGGIFVSTDNGDTWNTANNGITGMSLYVNKLFYKSYPVITYLLAATYTGVFVSNDHGSSWNGPYGPAYANCLEDSGRYVFAGSSPDGIYRAPWGTLNTWAQQNNGLVSTSINTLYRKDSILFAGTIHGVSSSYDKGNNWTTKETGLTAVAPSCLFIYENNFFVGTSENGLFFTGDDGATWQEKNNLLGTNNNNINAILFKNDSIYLGNASGVHISLDNGGTWADLNCPYGNIQKLCFKGSRLYVGSLNGICYTDDNGQHWNDQNTGLDNPAGLFIRGLLVKNNILFLANSQGVLSYNENTSSWETLNDGLPVGVVTIVLDANDSNLFLGAQSGFYALPEGASAWIARNTGFTGSYVLSLKSFGHNLFLGDNTGIYFSNDLGLHWTEVSNSIFTTQPYVISLAVENGNVYAGNNGSSVWKRPLTDFNINHTGLKENSFSNTISIYPNPATGDNIHIHIPFNDNKKVKAEITNTLGCLIYSNEFTNNTQTIVIQKPTLKKGIYLIKISSDDFVVSKKIIFN